MVRSKYRGDIADTHASFRANFDNGMTRTNSADYRVGCVIDDHMSTLYRRTWHAIGVSERNRGDPDRSFGNVIAAVADTIARAQLLNPDNARLQAH